MATVKKLYLTKDGVDTEIRDDYSLDVAGDTATGALKCPTPAAGTDDTTIPTTEWVKDITNLLAPIESPTFTGTVKAPTPVATSDDTTVPTTAWVNAKIPSGSSYVLKEGDTMTGALKTPTPASTVDDTTVPTTEWVKDITGLLAPIANPTFTGTVKAPTPAETSEDTTVPTTAWVKAAIKKYLEDNNYVRAKD